MKETRKLFGVSAGGTRFGESSKASLVLLVFCDERHLQVQEVRDRVRCGGDESPNGHPSLVLEHFRCRNVWESQTGQG